MKKLFLILFVLLVSSNLHSDENGERKWVLVSNNSAGKSFVDLNSVKSSDEIAITKYINLISWKKPQGEGERKYYSMQSYVKAQCTQPRKTAIYLLQTYDVQMEDADIMKGNIVLTLSINDKDLEWSQEIPGSTESKELDLVCAEREKQWKATQKKALKILDKKDVREKIESLNIKNLKK
jgi:hypothetical protein